MRRGMTAALAVARGRPGGRRVRRYARVARRNDGDARQHPLTTGRRSRLDRRGGAAVQTDGFESLGPIVLNVWSYDNQDPGLMPVIKELTKQFEQKYPNVKINLTFKDFNSLVNSVNRALASDNGPDITEGNQGYQIDAELGEGQADPAARQVRQGVRLGQVVGPGHEPDLPVDRRRQDVRPGPDLGRRPDRPERRPLRQQEEAGRLGLHDPGRRSTTSTRCWPSAQGEAAASEPVIELGNKEGYGTIHFMGGIQGAYGDAKPLRDWIFHVPGSTFDRRRRTRRP